MILIDTFEKHRSEPEKTLEAYTRDVRIALGLQIAKCKKIYLDTKFSPQEELVVQKAFFDQMWTISLSQMIKIMSLILSGADLKDAKEMIGHSDISMTDRYTHLTTQRHLQNQRHLAQHYTGVDIG